MYIGFITHLSNTLGAPPIILNRITTATIVNAVRTAVLFRNDVGSESECGNDFSSKFRSI